MNALLLRALNPFIFVLLMMAGVALQTSLFREYPMMYLQPDVLLIGIVWCAFKRSLFEGGILTLIFANIAEVHSATPQGFFFVLFMAIYLLIRASDYYLLLNRGISLVWVTIYASIGLKLMTIGLEYWMGITTRNLKFTFAIAPFGIVIEALVAIWLFQLLEKFDKLTSKFYQPQVLEEELLFDEEGL